MRNAHCRIWSMAIKLENEKKKMRNPHNRTWNKGRNTEKVENEKNTL
jgi:hypothetical protein